MSHVLDEMIEPMPELVSVMVDSHPLLLALDLGTSGVRAALYDQSGSELSGASVRINSRLYGLLDEGAADAHQGSGEAAESEPGQSKE